MTTTTTTTSHKEDATFVGINIALDEQEDTDMFIIEKYHTK